MIGLDFRSAVMYIYMLKCLKQRCANIDYQIVT